MCGSIYKNWNSNRNVIFFYKQWRPGNSEYFLELLKSSVNFVQLFTKEFYEMQVYDPASPCNENSLNLVASFVVLFIATIMWLFCINTLRLVISPTVLIGILYADCNNKRKSVTKICRILLLYTQQISKRPPKYD